MVDITSSRLLLAIKFSNSVPITLAKAVGHFCFVDSVGFMQDNVKGLQNTEAKEQHVSRDTISSPQKGCAETVAERLGRDLGSRVHGL